MTVHAMVSRVRDRRTPRHAASGWEDAERSSGPPSFCRWSVVLGVAAMSLGLVERALEMSLEYANTRVQFDQPIGNYQLIQLKLAKMEVARLNLENLVFRFIETRAAGKPIRADAL